MGPRRSLILKTWLHSFPPSRWVALLLTLASLPVRPARADDLVRQVQEELRKRSLYFGDVDGTLSPPTAAALRRYQQRKGFPMTGEPDAVTLYSLMIPMPAGFAGGSPVSQAAASVPASPVPSAVAAFGEDHPWPDVTVLRSDEARRQQLPPEPIEGETTPVPSPTRPPAPPPAAASRRRVTVEEARAFIERYLQAGQTNDPQAELAFYGERVDYFNEGIVDRRFIDGDITRYDRRWPERRFTLLEPFTLANSPDGDPDKIVVSFRYQFANKGAKYLVHGKTDNTWTLAGATPADLRIIAIKEQRVPRATPTPAAPDHPPAPR